MITLEYIENIAFYDDYKTQLDETIEDIIEPLTRTHIHVRIAFIKALTDKYIEETGERPSEVALNRLADALLYDYLEGDTRKNKMSVEEFPIMSDSQYADRTRGDRSGGRHLGYEVSLEAAHSVGSDGDDHSIPIRRYD